MATGISAPLRLARGRTARPPMIGHLRGCTGHDLRVKDIVEASKPR